MLRIIKFIYIEIYYNDMDKRIYWNLGTKVEMGGLQEHNGSIMGADYYNLQYSSSGIILEVLRHHDSNLSKITIRDSFYERGPINHIPTAVENLYGEFFINHYSCLKEEGVIGFYSEKDVLLGISKRVSD
jgi:hypothetical protein